MIKCNVKFDSHKLMHYPVTKRRNLSKNICLHLLTHHQIEDELLDLLARLGADLRAELDQGAEEPLHLKQERKNE